jgi:hypothetical protein
VPNFEKTYQIKVFYYSLGRIIFINIAYSIINTSPSLEVLVQENIDKKKKSHGIAAPFRIIISFPAGKDRNKAGKEKTR